MRKPSCVTASSSEGRVCGWCLKRFLAHHLELSEQTKIDGVEAGSRHFILCWPKLDILPASQLLPSAPHYLRSNRPHCDVLELQVFNSSSYPTLSVLAARFDRQMAAPASWFKRAGKKKSSSPRGASHQDVKAIIPHRAGRLGSLPHLSTNNKLALLPLIS